MLYVTGVHICRYTGIREEMMDGIRALVEVNGLNFDINNHRHMVNTLLHAMYTFVILCRPYKCLCAGHAHSIYAINK